MNQIYADVGLVMLLLRMVTPNVHFHLFTNNVTPTRDTVLGDLIEMAVAGYALQSVPVASFTLSGVAAHIGSLLAAPIAFPNISGAPVSAYGYYATDAANTTLLFAARFDGAPVTKADGDSWLVTPIIGDFSGLSS